LSIRSASVLLPHADAVLNLLAGSLVGGWLGASWAVRMRSPTLYRVLAVLLVAMAVVLVIGHAADPHPLPLSPIVRAVTGVAAGIAIGVVAALMGVAGGELLIPTIVILYGVDVKIAGSLALAVSLPTMLVAFARYRRDAGFRVVRDNARFAVAMVLGSIAGAVLGSLLLGLVPDAVLVPALALILLASPEKVWQHSSGEHQFR
jgi:uncharacterized protein